MNIKSNILLYYLFSFVSVLQFYGPVFAIFFNRLNLTQTQILSFLSIYAVATFLFEMPSGIFSDYLGRKKTMLISAIMLTASFLTITLGNVYWHFALGYFLMGVAWAFRSGTDESFVYDTLVQLKRRADFKKVLGKGSMVATIALAISAPIGSLIYPLDIRLPYILTTIAVASSIIIALLLTEPKRTAAGKSFVKHTLASLKLLRTNKILFYLTPFHAITMTGTVISYFLIQQYYSFIGIPAALFGFVMLGSMAIASLVSKYAHNIEGKLKEMKSFVLIAISMVAGYALLASFRVPFGFIFPYLIIFSGSFAYPVISDYMNKHIPSDKRATVLSLSNQLKNTFFLIVPLLIGMVADKSLQSAFAVMTAGLILLYPILIYKLFHAHKKYLSRKAL